MKYTQKMKLLPAQDGGSTEVEEETVVKGKVNSIRKYALERQQKLLKVILKLALANGYDNSGRMRESDGSFLREIYPLIMHAFSPGRSLAGLNRFVRLLKEAGVKPDEVINENVKHLLTNTISSDTASKNKVYESREPDVPEYSTEQSKVSEELPLPPPLIPMVPLDDPRIIEEERKRQKPESMDVTINLKRKRPEDTAHDVPAKRVAWDRIGHE